MQEISSICKPIYVIGSDVQLQSELTVSLLEYSAIIYIYIYIYVYVCVCLRRKE